MVRLDSFSHSLVTEVNNGFNMLNILTLLWHYSHRQIRRKLTSQVLRLKSVYRETTAPVVACLELYCFSAYKQPTIDNVLVGPEASDLRDGMCGTMCPSMSSLCSDNLRAKHVLYHGGKLQTQSFDPAEISRWKVTSVEGSPPPGPCRR